MGISDSELEQLGRDWDAFAARLYLQGYRKFARALRESIKEVLRTLEQSGSEVFTSSLADLLVSEFPISIALREQVNLVADKTARQLMRSYAKYLPDNVGVSVGFGNQSFVNGINEYMGTTGATHVQDITKTTRELIQQAFTDSAANSETTAQLAKRIEKYTVGQIGKSRAKLIARTETLMSSALAKELQSDAMPYVLDTVWIHDSPKTPRSWHLDLHLKKVPKGEKFKVVGGGETRYMKYAGDSEGGAINVCNCKCTHVYKPKVGKDGQLIKK